MNPRMDMSHPIGGRYGTLVILEGDPRSWMIHMFPRTTCEAHRAGIEHSQPIGLSADRLMAFYRIWNHWIFPSITGFYPRILDWYREDSETQR